MATVTVAEDRATHWIRVNHQNRIPKRWVVFDTESKSVYHDKEEIQSWRMGAAIRWRYGLKAGDYAEAQTFTSALDLWKWVTDYCRPGQRTIAVAHNLGYDVRIAEVLDTLPKLGWRLEWCNLDRNVSVMTWRSDKGTLVLADSWTWVPMPLAMVAQSIGMRKLNLPPDTAKHNTWEKYCMRDAEITYRVVSDLVNYIGAENLGNWQPTGAGMAYATWRHKFMTHKPLVHSDVEALTAERAAMHTGRAEAWRHGSLSWDVWTEVDMKNAYVRIASECELPTKLKFRTGPLTLAQYGKLSEIYRVNCRVTVTTEEPTVPFHNGQRTLWPTGTFTSWLWDVEVNELLASGAIVKIRDAYTYTRTPMLRDWANWVLHLLSPESGDVSPVVRTWAKHCSRALIGRLSLRSPKWEQFGANPGGITGISHVTDGETGVTSRLMHVGDRTLIETARTEGRDSLPQVTGWIMAECRVRLWGAMRTAGLAEIAHVDTDSLIVSRAGLEALRAAWGQGWRDDWQVKGSWPRMIIYGPRNYRAGDRRWAAGVPKKAKETLPNTFHGERWHGLAGDVEAGRASSVTVETGTWVLVKADPRRQSVPGAGTATVAYAVGAVSSVAASSSSRSGDGA